MRDCMSNLFVINVIFHDWIEEEFLNVQIDAFNAGLELWGSDH